MGVGAECFVPVFSRDPPSYHSSLEVIFPRSCPRTRRAIPRWGPSHPVFRQLLQETVAAIAGAFGSPFETMSDITYVAHAIMPEIRRSLVPPGSAVFAWEDHWLAEARAACGSGADHRLHDDAI